MSEASPKVDWWLYILQSTVSGRFYIGIALDPDKRLTQHNTGSRGAKATRGGRPWQIVYRELVGAKGDALRRELALKKLGRAQKVALVSRETSKSLVKPMKG